MPAPKLTPSIPKYCSSRKRRISAAPDRPVKPPKAQHLTNYDKLRIIELIHNRPPGTSVYQVVPSLRELGYSTIVPSTLSRLLKDEAKIRAYVQSNPQRLFEKHPPILVLPEVDAAVAQWVIQKLSNPRIRLTGDMIREKAREFNSLLGYPDDILVFSSGWLERFKIRIGLSRHVFHGEASSAPVERLQDERYRLLSIIALFAPWDVYNVDETALLFCLVPTSGLALDKMPGVKLDKKRLTYMFCANMDGSDKRTPLIIGRAKQPRCFEGRSAEAMRFYYFWNSKAWQVHSIWKSFLSDLNEDMRRQGRYILLLCDNAPSHKHDPAQYPHVRVEFLAPNLTSHIQPMDGESIQYRLLYYRGTDPHLFR
ncbi:tigger transposable element derived-like protein, putative, partial [Rhizoctonia solani AG-3 Rhs1AP]